MEPSTNSRDAGPANPGDPNLVAKEAYFARKAKEKRQGAYATALALLGVLGTLTGPALFVLYFLVYSEDPEAARMAWVYLGAVLLASGLFLLVFGVRLLVAVKPVVNRYSGWQWRAPTIR